MLIPVEAYDLLISAGVGVLAERRSHGVVVDLTLVVPTEIIPPALRVGPALVLDERAGPAGGALGAQLVLDVTVSVSLRAVRPSVLDALSRSAPGVDDGRGPAVAGVLLICPEASPQVRRRCREEGISLICLNPGSASGPDGHLVLAPGRVLALGAAAAPSSPREPSPRSWARWQVLRTVALLPGVRQRELADAAGVSQARISQLLAELVAAGLVVKGVPVDDRLQRPPASRAWRIADWGRLLRVWRKDYPGAGGVATHWYGLNPLPAQVDAALAFLRRVDGHAAARRGSLLTSTESGVPACVSGDVVADVFAPWGRPARAVVYTPSGRDLAAGGLVACPAAEATLTLVVPQDPGVFGATSPRRAELTAPTRDEPTQATWMLADPLQVLVDVAAGPSVDSGQMADRFERWLLEQLEGAGPNDLRRLWTEPRPR